jgi:ArsR family transcriptional regulator
MDTTLPIRSPRSRPTADAGEACCAQPVLAPIRLDPPRSVALADRLKALADPTRLRILDLLAAQTEQLCVCDITSQFPQNQPTISHHLRILREARLVEGEKRGVWGYYWATEEGRRVLATVSSSL